MAYLDPRFNGQTNKPNIEQQMDIDYARRQKEAYSRNHLHRREEAEARKAMDKVFKVLAGSKDLNKIRKAAKEALSKMPEKGPSAVEGSRALLKSMQAMSDKELREFSKLTKKFLSKTSKEAVPELINMLKINREEAREAAKKALGEMPKEAVPELINVLKQKNAADKKQAKTWLEKARDFMHGK